MIQPLGSICSLDGGEEKDDGDDEVEGEDEDDGDEEDEGEAEDGDEEGEDDDDDDGDKLIGTPSGLKWPPAGSTSELARGAGLASELDRLLCSNSELER